MHFDIRNYSNKNIDDEEFISLYKFLSPVHLLKRDFLPDTNKLNKEFYNELLHILGLVEKESEGKIKIERKLNDRNEGSLLELTIAQLETVDISQINDLNIHGENHEEQVFGIAFSLVITWINRILFIVTTQVLFNNQHIIVNKFLHHSFFFNFFFFNFAAMEEMITISRSEYEQMLKEREEFRALVLQLQEEISLLKGGRNSRTSSTAPSQDLGRSNQISLRKPSGKKSGGQIGHSGRTLYLSDNPDEIIDHSPSVCSHCGEELHGVDSSSFTRRQEVDIPPIHPIYIEHRSHIKECPLCGFKNRGIFPEHVQAPIQYGSRVEATVGYLSVYQTLPYNRITRLFKDFFGLPLSEGSVDNFLDNLAQKAQPIYEVIRGKIEQSEVVGSDETGCRVNGKKHWFHVWQNNVLTFIVAFATRGYKVIEKYFAEGFKLSIYTSEELLKTDYSKFHQKEQAFFKRLIKYRQSIFTFLSYQNVPPDNNASERAIRNVKVKTKVSGLFRNKEGKGADRYAKIRSVIDTTIKNGQEVYATLVCMANCRIVKVVE